MGTVDRATRSGGGIQKINGDGWVLAEDAHELPTGISRSADDTCFNHGTDVSSCKSFRHWR